MGLALGNATDNIILLNGSQGVTITSVISGVNKKLTLQGAGTGTLTLGGINTYSGDTTINTNKLALTGSVSIANSPNIVISGNGTFDVSTLTAASFNLSSGQGIKATGTTSNGVLAMGTKNIVMASNSPLQFTAFNGTTAPLSTSGTTGTLNLASTNPVTVTVSNGGVPLVAGSYTLVSKGAGGGVSGTAPSSVTVNGDGIAPLSTASLSITGSQLVLTVTTIPAATIKFRSKQTGNWNATSTWETSTDGNTWVNAVTTPDSTNDTITIQNGHIVTVTASVGADQLTVNAGGILSVNNGVSFTIFDGAGNDLTVASTGIFATGGATSNNGQAQINGTLRIDQGGFPGGGGTYAYDQTTGALLFNHTSGTYGPINSSHVYWPSSGGPQNVSVGTAPIDLGVARTVGLSFDTSAQVFGANNLTIGSAGTFTIFAGGSCSGSPTYNSGSTLKYSTGGSYGRNGEWLAVTSGAGYPSNVLVTGNTSLDTSNGGTFNSAPSQIGGGLTINSGSSLSMSAMTQPITVVGNVTNGGTLTLSTASGGDIKLQGNWSDSGTFNPNGRAVYFEGGNSQTITRTGGETFNYLVINKSAAGVSLSSDVTVNATSGNALQITGSSTLPLNLTGKTLTMSGNGGSLLVSGGERKIGNNGGTLAFTGSKSVVSASSGTLTLMSSVTTSLSSAVNFGAGVTTLGDSTLVIKAGGSVDTNPPTYSGSATLDYDTGGTYNTAAEFPSTGVPFVLTDSTTQLNLDSDKTVSGFNTTFCNVGSTTSTPRSLTAGSLSITLATVTLNNLNVSGSTAVLGTLNIAGDWNVTTLSGPGTVNFNGTGAQTIQSANTFNNLTTSNDLTLGAATTVNGTLALGSKKITTGAFTLSLGNSASLTRTSGYVVGTLQKSFNAPASFTFPVGTANGYSPVDANSTTGTGSLAVKPTQVKQPNVAGTNALSRYWTLTGTGVTTNLTFHYLAGDVAGTEANYKIFKYTGGTFTQFTPTNLDTTNHTATLNGVNSFSDWTLAESAAVNGALQFSASNYDDAEGNSGAHNVTVTVQRTGGSSGAVSVHFATSDGTATAGSDYLATSGDLNWADGDAADKTFNVSVNGDTTNEPDETINLTLSAPTGGASLGSPSSATVTIQNDDAASASTVYVDDDWAGTTAGADPDGAGPATNFGYDAFSTIQNGVNGVASGGTVNVLAGNYAEQVTISKSLTLAGASAATTNITTPATLTPGIGGNLVLVQIDSAAVVEMSGVTVKGPRVFNACSSQIFYGVYVAGAANLNLHDSAVRDIRMANPSLYGCQDGVAVRAGSQALGQTATLTLTNDTISGYQKGGVVIDGTGTTATVTNATLTGFGPENLAQNAVQIGRGAGATVTGSTVTGNECNNPVCGPDPFTQSFGTGFLVFSTSAAVQITNNTISNNDTGVYNNAANTTISGNTMSGNRFNSIFLDEGSATVSNNNLSGTSNVGVLAVSYFGNDGNSVGTLDHNNITGAGVGLQLLDDTSGADAFVPQLTAHYNRVVATTTAIDNPQNQTADFENNWWGCNAGPGNAGCGAVTGTGADFNPWFVLAAQAAPNSIIPGASSNVTVDMTRNSDGVVPSSTLPDLPVSYSAVNGTMSPTSGTVSAGTASSTFTSTNGSNATATVTVDSQNINLPITVNAPSFTINDVTHNEGNTGTTTYTFTVTKTGSTMLAASVDFTTVDGTATVADADYAANSGTLNFAAADATMTVNVTVNGDTAVEPTEAFTVHLSNPSNATIADADGTGTITNDDALAAPSVVYVDDDWAGTTAGTDPDGAGPATNFGYDAFSKIQDGVNGVAAGGTVNVYAGTYNEDVNANKAGVTLTGIGAGSKTIVGPIGGDGATVHINASNVTVAGFFITRAGNNTTDWNNPGLNSTGVAIQGLSITGALIRDNTITGNRTGIDINNSGGHTVRNNSITDNRTGMIMRNQTDQLTVVENFITNNWTVGVLFLDASGGSNSPAQQAHGSFFNNNDLSGNWYAQIVDRQSGGSLPAPGTTNLKNFRGDWFGTTAPVVTTANSAEPGYAAQIPVEFGGTAAAPGGQPDIAGPASANFVYQPFLLSGTDTNVETVAGRGTNGFQGVQPAAVRIRQNNLHGWQQQHATCGASATGAQQFVVGPATPPAGEGSLQYSIGADGDSFETIRNPDLGGVRLDALSALSYATYVSQDGSGGQAAYLLLNIDFDNDGALDDQLFFEPVYQGATFSPSNPQGPLTTNTWQTWDALHGGWWSTGNVAGAGPGTNVKTIAQYLAAQPNARIVNGNTGLGGFRIATGCGAGDWDNFVGNADNLLVGVSGANTRYDLEPLPRISVSDVTHNEGDSGTTAYDFHVTLSAASDQAVTVDYATADDTATVADGDYQSNSGTLTFNPGETDKTVTVLVNGDTKYEANEQFFLNLSNPNANATILDAQGVGTITNDDTQPSFTIDDVTHNEGNSGTTSFTFTVTKNGATAFATSVDFTTADGTATTADNDYQSNSGTLNFAAGDTTQQITVLVNGDTTYEATETFFVNLLNASGATIGDAQGQGTITNDDAPPATLTVNTTADTDDGLCTTSPAGCTLREAINAANAAGDANTVGFNIPVSDAGYNATTGLWTISPASVLPTITGPATIDGYTQAGASPNTNATGALNAVLKIVLSGQSLATGSGITITASNSTVRGLVINGFDDGAAVVLAGATGCTVAGNYIGTDAAGATAVLNDFGVQLNAGSANNYVGTNGDGSGDAAERNLISGSRLAGVRVKDTGASGNVVAGNLVGTDAAGAAAVGNNDGIEIAQGGTNNRVGTNADGTSDDIERNVASGNRDSGIYIWGGATGNVVAGNYVGTDGAGAASVANVCYGVSIARTPNNTVGGLTAAERNVVSGNQSGGVELQDTGATGNVVEGNYVGVAADGTTALGNTPGRCDNGHGVIILDGAVGNTVGGTAAGASNLIAHNNDAGVLLYGPGVTNHNSVRGNSVFSNGGLGIDLSAVYAAADGVTANDAGDSDSGVNDLQNFPVITSATVTGSTRTITGTLNSTPNSTFVIDFYANASCDSSGYGEGQTYLGSVTTAATDANGDVSFTFHPTALSASDSITATATDANGNTSEFSQCFGAASGTPGDIVFTSASYAVAENVAGGFAQIGVTRAGGSDGQITATFSTSDGTATAGSDYTAVTNYTVTFNDGETGTKVIDVPILDDAIYEGTETVNLDLSATTVLRRGGAQKLTSLLTHAVLNITDNEAVPSFSVGDVFVSEPQSGTSTATFTVTLSGPAQSAVSVNYATADVTATAPADYDATSGTLNFAPGDTSEQVSVTIKSDALAEGNETFTLNLSSPTPPLTISDASGTGTIVDPVLNGQVIISEFRVRGAQGARDEFVELYNNTNHSITVATDDGTPGWGLAALLGDGTTVDLLATIPAGTILPPRAHYLVAGVPTAAPATGYSLPAAPDLTYDKDIADGTGVAVFRTNSTGAFSNSTRLDAAGFSGLLTPTADLFREGAGLPSTGTADGEYSYTRNLQSGTPKDTNDNVADFFIVSTDGGVYGGTGTVLGAPGPENLVAPLQRSAHVRASLVDVNCPGTSTTAGDGCARYRNSTPGDPNTSAAGTLAIRRKWTNNTGTNVTRLRFRVVDITTRIAGGEPPSGTADVRLLTSTTYTASLVGGGTTTVRGLTLEQPPAQVLGGGLNSTVAAGIVSTGTPLSPNASVNVEFLLGVQQPGSFRFFIIVEAVLDTDPPTTAAPAKHGTEKAAPSNSKNKPDGAVRID